MQTACGELPETQIRATYLMEPARRQVQRLARMQVHDPGSLPPLYSGWANGQLAQRSLAGWQGKCNEVMQTPLTRTGNFGNLPPISASDIVARSTWLKFCGTCPDPVEHTA
jgi:hypothetical protein